MMNIETIASSIRQMGASVGVSDNFFTPSLHITFFTREQHDNGIKEIASALLPNVSALRQEVSKTKFNAEYWTYKNNEKPILRVYVVNAFCGYPGMYE